MGDDYYVNRSGVKIGHVLILEKQLLQKHYDFLKVRVSNGAIYCYGYFKPSEYSVTYYYKIRFIPEKPPKVFITNPVIQYNDDIHLYKQDNSLCLYYPKDFSWTKDSRLYNTVVPWTHEWILFYELYQITGIWQHPFVNHLKI